VPPNSRVVVVSACVNGSKMRESCSAVMPMPLSVTRKLEPRLLVALTARHGKSHFAFVRELRGVREQIEQDLAQLRGVGVHRADRVGQIEHQSVAVLLDQRGDGAGDPFHGLAQVEALRVHLHAPGFDLREVEHVV